MQVILKILHGTLRDKEGRSTAPEVIIRRPHFVIGSAPDCSMRCPSTAVAAHHCEIRIDAQEVTIRNLRNETGTFVNDQRVEGIRVLRTDDHLRIGRLEFEVLLDESAPTHRPVAPSPEGFDEDVDGDLLSDLLLQADERERELRRYHPESRQFQMPASRPKTPAAKAAPKKKASQGKDKKKTKQPPGKLPVPPPKPFDDAENSVEAAEEALRKLFSR
jgi:pSer/pThr/pTyr-binding forkhead associated (FHA) protein